MRARAKKKPEPRDKCTKLMKAMGSATGAFDPEPPDHWKYDLLHGAPDDRYVAWVKSKTIAVGHMTPYATGERGPAGQEGPKLTLRDARHELAWERKFAEKVARECDRQGRTRRDPRLNADGSENHNRRIWLCAEVSEVRNLEESATYEKDGTVYSSSDSPFLLLLPSYVADQVKMWDPERQHSTEQFLRLFQGWYNRSLAESAQATRAMTDRVLHSVLESLGAQYRPEPVKKRGRPNLGRAAQSDLFDWREVKTAHMRISLTKIPAELEALLPDTLKAPVQAPPESAQVPVPVPEVPETGLLYTTENGTVHEPVSLLHSDPDSVGIRESVAHTSSVSQSTADGPTTATPSVATPEAKEWERKTPPVKAAPPPQATSKTAAAIPDGRKIEKKPGTPGSATSKERTGLTSTPSIERRERLSAICAQIPDELATRLQQRKDSPHLLRQIDDVLQGAPASHFGTAVANADKAGRFEKYPTLGLCIKLAEQVGQTWAAGAAKRELEATAAAAARKADDAQSRRQQEESAAAERKRQHLLEHPEDCPFCAGRGKHHTDSLPEELRPRNVGIVICGCPAGDKLRKGVHA